MMARQDPATDCPACPSCGGPFGTPIAEARGSLGHVDHGRWYGPDNATLFCPACGAGWVANEADHRQAVRAYLAWHRKERGIAGAGNPKGEGR